MTELSPHLVHRLEERVARAQRDYKTPALSVSIVRDGVQVWSHHRGIQRFDVTDPAAGGPVPTDDTRFMIGSITKTFTAVLVMMLRDEGKLALGDTVGRWLPNSKHAHLTIRELLAHSSGLQREPAGHLWEALDAPDRAAVIAGLEDAEQVLPEHHAFHYSNLAFMLLGEIAAQVSGREWGELVAERIWTPLGMTRTTLTPGDDRARGYYVHPYTGVATEEPLFAMGAAAPLGGIWSSVADMGRYAAFIADPASTKDAEGRPLLAPTTIDEMCRPLIMTDTDSWAGAYGLGLHLLRRGDRVHVGHGGAMPGYLSGLRVRRPEKMGCFAVASCTSGAATALLAAELIDLVLDEEPPVVPAWRPEAPIPALDELLGVWFCEGGELQFFVEDGQLHARLGHDDGPLSRTRFAPEGRDAFRAIEGRERGERLEIVRDAQGAIEKMYFATYAVTRAPLAFAQLG